MEQQLQNAIADCRQSKDAIQRQKALNRLLLIIQQLPGIYTASHQDYPEAYNRTLEWACKNIDRFEPVVESTVKSMVIWLNGYLKWRIRDLYISDNSYDPLRVYPSPREDNDLDPIEAIADPQISLSLLDTQIAQMQAEQEQNIGVAIANFIEQDTAQNLATTHPRKHPQCNCHCLAKRMLLADPPEKISTIAKDLQVNNQTLYSHWKKKCLPLLQEIANSLNIEH